MGDASASTMLLAGPLIFALPLLTPGRVATPSTLTGTDWQIKLNLGLEDGSWMPNTIEGWGASGGRAIVNVHCTFLADAAGEGEELVGPASQTRVLKAQGASTIVTAKGEEQVVFNSGGWCVQRPMGARPESEGELRFWLDCESGVTRGDVTVPVGERLFFCTSVWDDSDGLEQLALEKANAEEKLAEMITGSEEEEERGASSLEAIPLLGDALALRRRVLLQEEQMRARERSKYFERCLPLLGDDDRPAQLAPQGVISLKRTRGQGPFTKSAFHILGKFTGEPYVPRGYEGAPL